MSARLAAQPAGIEGTVVDETTGKPLDRVHVVFVGAATYGAMSNNAGRFSIAPLPPGAYRLNLERTGYLQTTDDRGVSLKAGQQVGDLTVKMALASMISGRVLDSYGDPVAGINLRISPSTTMGEDPQTDDRGEFHILAGPGKYRLSAEPEAHAQNGPPEVRTDGTSEPAYGPTYYPILDVSAGHDVEGIEIHLAAAAVQRRFSVSGTVSGEPAYASSVMVVVQGGSQQGLEALARVDRNGKFSVSGLLPGPYEIGARSEMNIKPQAAWASVNLDDADLSGVELVLHDPGELTGTLAIKSSVPAGRKVHLESAGGLPLLQSQNVSADVDKDGAFHIRDVWPERFRVSVSPLPDTAYVQSLDMDGEPVNGGEIEVHGGNVPHLKITVALDGASVAGKVPSENGEGMQVFLLADPKTVTQSAFSVDGRYSLKGIVPGKYRLAVSPAGGDIDTAALFAAAEEIELKPGDRVVKDFSDGKK